MADVSASPPIGTPNVSRSGLSSLDEAYQGRHASGIPIQEGIAMISGSQMR